MTDATFSKIIQLVSGKCLCRGCFPVSYFKLPTEFETAADHFHLMNTLNDKLAECIGIEKGFWDAELQSRATTSVR